MIVVHEASHNIQSRMVGAWCKRHPDEERVLLLSYCNVLLRDRGEA